MDGPTFTKQNEGCRLAAYQDTLGVWTIGYGHTGPDIYEGLIWKQAQCEQAFSDDYATATANAHTDVGDICWTSLSEPRQAAITDMAFQLGRNGLAKFRHMIGYLQQNDYEAASAAALASEWANQTPVRAKRVASLIQSGEFPADA